MLKNDLPSPKISSEKMTILNPNPRNLVNTQTNLPSAFAGAGGGATGYDRSSLSQIRKGPLFHCLTGRHQIFDLMVGKMKLQNSVVMSLW
ncbi:hypothetical protein MRB53_014324 [Persea americana]|uniref:Uncharacterized protein n=1 Tax=Persea americana TaxID=3435 RepID=A0ACC2KAQ6_PERAE|nr:hypothetical protein MRB53_014324 [Persea americana]